MPRFGGRVGLDLGEMVVVAPLLLDSLQSRIEISVCIREVDQAKEYLDPDPGESGYVDSSQGHLGTFGSNTRDCFGLERPTLDTGRIAYRSGFLQ